MPRPVRPSWRKIWLQLHLWLGLTIGAVAALLGVTGAALVVKEPWLRLELGAMARPVDPAAAPLPPDLQVQAAQAIATGGRRLLSVAAPGSGPMPVATVLALLTEPAGESGPRFLVATFDPARGDLLGVRPFGDLAFAQLLDLHRALIGGPTGAGLVAVVGVVLCLSLATGAYLWWPRRPDSGRRRGFWRRRLLPSLTGPWHRQVRVLHVTAGIWLLLPLAVVAVTGTLLARPDLIGAARRGLPLAAAAPPAPDDACVAVPDAATAVRLGLAASQSGTFLGVMAAGSGWMVTTTTGMLMVDPGMLDPGCGTVTAMPRGPDLHGVMNALHGRLMLGWPGQVVAFLAGLALPVFYVTGLVIWLRRRR
ncbi:PepSY domain-containing protein [uncultured Tistrella sp.]|uniref:PepSY-associated TM helix domain-containing protein n=1 Tax=Tistrella mobilis TaxID=171437 RepID=UPI000C0B658A|nr:PepSY-associated TM helix domain-containing protein [uncultured Tistrella sp.]MAM75997.1 hypothetical protein [Tistrella sp.]